MIKDKKEAKPDMVNHPSHYTQGRYEVFDVLMDWFAKEPLLWQIVKYLARCMYKGKMLEDLRKAEWYLKRKIEQVEEEQCKKKAKPKPKKLKPKGNTVFGPGKAKAVRKR